MFADFVAGVVLLFCGRKWPEKFSRKSPAKCGKSPATSSKIYTTKIPDIFLQRVKIYFCGRQSEKPCDLCSGLSLSPLAAAMVTAILQCEHCAAKMANIPVTPTTNFENAPTCYRNPRWPEQEFPRRIPKKNTSLPEIPRKHTKTSRPEILDPQQTPRKYQRTSPEIRRRPSLFFCIFVGIFSAFQNFGAGSVFSAFFVEFPGPAIAGLCSRLGHCQHQCFPRSVHELASRGARTVVLCNRRNLFLVDVSDIF